MLRTTAHPIADVSHHSLLVVEDALVHRTIISKIGDKVGFVARSASSVEAAEALLRTQQFDAITLDLGLGEHVGIEVLRLLADLKSKTPIIIISASDDSILEETCRRALARPRDLEAAAQADRPDAAARDARADQARLRPAQDRPRLT
jgi:CheY-like chemotaxis protein